MALLARREGTWRIRRYPGGDRRATLSIVSAPKKFKGTPFHVPCFPQRKAEPVGHILEGQRLVVESEVEIQHACLNAREARKRLIDLLFKRVFLVLVEVKVHGAPGG